MYPGIGFFENYGSIINVFARMKSMYINANNGFMQYLMNVTVKNIPMHDNTIAIKNMGMLDFKIINALRMPRMGPHSIATITSRVINWATTMEMLLTPIDLVRS
jgi:hypothetical protein